MKLETFYGRNTCLISRMVLSERCPPVYHLYTDFGCSEWEQYCELYLLCKKKTNIIALFQANNYSSIMDWLFTLFLSVCALLHHLCFCLELKLCVRPIAGRKPKCRHIFPSEVWFLSDKVPRKPIFTCY